MARDISHLLPDLNREISKFDRAITKLPREAVTAGARVAKEVQLDVEREDSGGDLRLSRVRSGRGAKVGARYDITGNGPTVAASVRAVGPLPLLASRIGAHDIPKRSGARLSIPGIGVRSNVRHPGSPGKDTWNRGRERAEPRIRAAVARQSDEAMRRAFLGRG